VETGKLCRRHGITNGCFYRWRGKFGGMEVSEAKRLRALEEGNRQLKHAVVAMRSEVAVSERRACGLMEIHSGTYRYRPRPEERRLRLRLRELAEQRRRFGYRRLQVLLVREGAEVNHKRAYRLYVEEKLSLRRKRGGRQRRAGVRVILPPPPSEPDQFWTMDFATDAFASGRRFRTLNLMDGFDREALEIEVDTSLGGVRGGCGRSQSGHARIYQGRIGKAREREMIVQHEHRCSPSTASAPTGRRAGKRLGVEQNYESKPRNCLSLMSTRLWHSTVGTQVCGSTGKTRP